MFSVPRQFASHTNALRYRYFRKESVYFVIRKCLSTSDSTITQDHTTNLNKSNAFNLMEANDKAVSVLRNYQAEAYNHLGQSYEEYINDLTAEIIKLTKELEKKNKFIQYLESTKEQYRKFIDKEGFFQMPIHVPEVRVKDLQETSRSFRLGRIRNVRSALEYVRRRMLLKEGKLFKSVEPVDSVLQRLSEEKRFKDMLYHSCKAHRIHIKLVKNCFGNLYHISCKGKHGHRRNIVLYAKYWRKEELLALSVIFDYFNIKFTYWNRAGKETSFPYLPLTPTSKGFCEGV
ncbi:3367_t:CDS:2 [Paraglomus occultum]|uniref:3367_t:CDS:1 n=1 Tax=Paraglomus occultum TaxID=144539 RepID=A0A9N9B2L1_9GLOM|nr:3367_t:CDS:2 [Paraglomus occultum]